VRLKPAIYVYGYEIDVNNETYVYNRSIAVVGYRYMMKYMGGLWLVGSIKS